MDTSTLVTRRVLALAVMSACAGELLAEDLTDAAIPEITVTARRKAENLQSTPLSVTAITAQDIEAKGMDNVFDVARARRRA